MQFWYAAPKHMDNTTRLLILEDRFEDAELIVNELRRCGLSPVWERVETEEDFLEHLDPPPDIILADYTLPRMDAPRALEALGERGLDIPFIVVSGTIGEDAAVAMMRRGAADYLLKDRMVRLGPAVKRALGESRLRQEKRKAEEELRASEVRFQQFMSNMPSIALIEDEDGRLVCLNDTARQIWGTLPWRGKLPCDRWPPHIAEPLRAHDLAVLKSGQPLGRAVLNAG